MPNKKTKQDTKINKILKELPAEESELNIKTFNFKSFFISLLISAIVGIIIFSVLIFKFT